jgi:hypothetical protein
MKTLAKLLTCSFLLSSCGGDIVDSSSDDTQDEALGGNGEYAYQTWTAQREGVGWRINEVNGSKTHWVAHIDLGGVENAPDITLFHGRVSNRTLLVFGGWRQVAGPSAAPGIAYELRRVTSEGPYLAHPVGGGEDVTITRITGDAGIVNGALAAMHDGAAAVVGTIDGDQLAATAVHAMVAADPMFCTAAADCTLTGYDHEISGASECYCAGCGTTLINAPARDEHQASWEAACSTVRLICPARLCLKPPAKACVSNRCQVAPPTD